MSGVSPSGHNNSFWDIFSPVSADFKDAEKHFHEDLSWDRQALVVIASIVGGLFFVVGAFPVFRWTVQALTPEQNDQASTVHEFVKQKLQDEKPKERHDELPTQVITKIDTPKIESLTDKLLGAYKTHQEGWVFVPPKEEIDLEKPFSIGSGAIGFSGNGRWKLHVSIDPDQMEEALPIILDVLHSSDAPRLGFKIQTKANLDSVHQIGKEVAILFDYQAEKAALEGDIGAIEACLNTLWSRLYSAGIRPEKGFVLTPQTVDLINKASKETQIHEKENLKRGKFDRAIPCPEGCNFFYYRDENFAPMLDEEIGNLKGEPGVYAGSDILALAKRRPDLAHNPTESPDPFLKLHIKITQEKISAEPVIICQKAVKNVCPSFALLQDFPKANYFVVYSSNDRPDLGSHDRQITFPGFLKKTDNGLPKIILVVMVTDKTPKTSFEYIPSTFGEGNPIFMLRVLPKKRIEDQVFEIDEVNTKVVQNISKFVEAFKEAG